MKRKKGGEKECKILIWKSKTWYFFFLLFFNNHLERKKHVPVSNSLFLSSASLLSHLSPPPQLKDPAPWPWP